MNKYPTIRGPFKDGERIKSYVQGKIHYMTPRQYNIFRTVYYKGGAISMASLNNIRKHEIIDHPFIYPVTRKEVFADPLIYPNHLIKYINSRPLTFLFYVIPDLSFAEKFMKLSIKESKFIKQWKKKLAHNAMLSAKVQREKKKLINKKQK